MKQQLLVICFLVVSIGLFAQSKWQKAVDQFMKDPALVHASVGICVMNNSNGKIVASYNDQQSLIPASSLKIVTTASALAILGNDFRFKTTLAYDGEIDLDGVLSGNIYIQGKGDPTLGSDVFTATPDINGILSRWGDAIQSSGIKAISGKIVGDGSYFSSNVAIQTWQWGDIGNYYGAGAYGLNFHENLYYLRFRQAHRLKETPDISVIEPEVPGLSFRNEVKSAGARSGDNAYIYGAPYSYLRYVRGTIPIGKGLFSIKGSIPDPPYFTAFHLAKKLEEIGISSNGVATQLQLVASKEVSKAERNIFHTHESPMLQEIVIRTNQKSINLYCESILKTIGQKRKKAGTSKAGLQALKEEWKGRGVDFSGVSLDDGSGLSPRDLVTARFMSRFLSKVSRDPKIATTFKNSLPLAGVSGILKRKFKGTAGYKKIWAKSGTLGGVRTYAGYCQNIKGEELSFCILVNNYKGSGGAMRKKMEQLMLQFCK